MLSVIPDMITIDAIDNDYYTVQIYVPDCNDELIFEEHKVSGQYLLEFGLGQRKGMFDDELKPISDYQRWEKYVIKETGNPIPDDNCCVIFTKE